MLKTIRAFMLMLVFMPAFAIAGTNIYTEINADQLVEMQKSTEGLVVIDSRGGKWFDNQVIEGAVHLSADNTDEAHLSEVAPAKDTPIVFYCSNVNCPASKAAAHQAHDAGYTNLYKYPGGIDDWKEKGLPTVTVQ
ncbi:MAG: rhodanese-like domain-containing protein [Alphaproteobacteria bacterium]